MNINAFAVGALENTNWMVTSAVEGLRDYPAACDGLLAFLRLDLAPVLNRQLDPPMELGA